MAEARKKAVKKKVAAPKIKKPVKVAAASVPEVEIQKEVVKESAPVTYIPKPKRRILPKGPKYFGTGRRKEAVAKVWIASGSGKISVNGKPYLQYFCGRKLLEFQVNRPFVTSKTEGKYDVFAEVHGGGVPGQAGALSLGIARSLIQMNPELKPALKKEGLLTRDPRMKERKKYGLKRARRAFQYSKR